MLVENKYAYRVIYGGDLRALMNIESAICGSATAPYGRPSSWWNRSRRIACFKARSRGAPHKQADQSNR